MCVTRTRIYHGLAHSECTAARTRKVHRAASDFSADCDSSCAAHGPAQARTKSATFPLVSASHCMHSAARQEEKRTMDIVATVMLTSIVLYMIQQVQDLK
jgi:hypothetical protein